MWARRNGENSMNGAVIIQNIEQFGQCPADAGVAVERYCVLVADAIFPTSKRSRFCVA